jgi:TctA family transporter
VEGQKRLGPLLERLIEGRVLWLFLSHRCHGRRLCQIALAAGVLIHLLTLGTSTTGVYGAGHSVLIEDLLFVFGLLSYLMRRFDFQAAPLIVGQILVPMVEQGLTIRQTEWSKLFTRPLSNSLMAVSVLFLVVPPLCKTLALR